MDRASNSDLVSFVNMSLSATETGSAVQILETNTPNDMDHLHKRQKGSGLNYLSTYLQIPNSHPTLKL